MGVSAAEIKHIASLARLGVSDERIAPLERELNAILEHMAVLQSVDTTGVAAATGIGAGGMPLRADAGEPIPMANGPSAFAPETRHGFLLVPRLATHEDGAESSA